MANRESGCVPVRAGNAKDAVESGGVTLLTVTRRLSRPCQRQTGKDNGVTRCADDRTAAPRQRDVVCRV